MVPPAIAPALLFCSDLPPPAAALVVEEAAEDPDAIVEVKLEVVLGASAEELSVLELELESEVVEADAELELSLEDIEVDDSVVGLKVTPVNTTCKSRSVGWPLKEVSTVVA